MSVFARTACYFVLILHLVEFNSSAPFEQKISAPARPCDHQTCKLPTCFCSGIKIPGEMDRSEIPQMVFLTFDDSVSDLNYELYEEILSNRYNPNGSPISTTFFVSHEYSNYYLIRKLYEQGHEIGLHSITHEKTGSLEHVQNETLCRQEIVDHRSLLSHFAKIPEKEIQGFRAPFLQGGGDAMCKVLHESGMGYDYSRSTAIRHLWPYTADYDTIQECPIEPCHSQSFPGLWIVPTVNFISNEGYPCAMVDACLPTPDDDTEAFRLLRDNFLDAYNGNRAPLAVSLHSSWLIHGGRRNGYKRFLDYLGTLSDVYVMSISKVLDWMKNPVNLRRMRELDSWKAEAKLTKDLGKANDCSSSHKCIFVQNDTPFGFEQSFTSCTPCPAQYPWIGNPFGERLLEERPFHEVNASGEFATSTEIINSSQISPLIQIESESCPEVGLPPEEPHALPGSTIKPDYLQEMFSSKPDPEMLSIEYKPPHKTVPVSTTPAQSWTEESRLWDEVPGWVEKSRPWDEVPGWVEKSRPWDEVPGWVEKSRPWDEVPGWVEKSRPWDETPGWVEKNRPWDEAPGWVEKSRPWDEAPGWVEKSRPWDDESGWGKSQ